MASNENKLQKYESDGEPEALLSRMHRPKLMNKEKAFYIANRFIFKEQ